MQIFGITKNHVAFEGGTPSDTPLSSRIFTKLESSHWTDGSKIIAPVPNMSGEIEVITRIDEAITRPVTRQDVAKLALSYGFGMDFGSGQRGREDGQFWRSKGSRGYAAVGSFVSGLEIGSTRGLTINVKDGNGPTTEVNLDGLQYNELDVIPLLSEHCDLAPGDLIYLGKLSLSRGFENGPKDITATSDVLPTFHIQTHLLPDGDIHASLIGAENAH